MSNPSPSLQEFVSPIPICQSEADLGNMLSIFQHVNCRALAIADGLGSWGVIYAQDLLSLIADTWLSDRILSNHLGHTSQQSMTKRMTNTRALIRSAKVYPADLKLNKFLSYLQHNSLSEEEVYLIADRQGLQGKLDRHKIIEYLAANSASKTKLELPSSLNCLADSIEAFSLPSKIATARGKTIYANQGWRDLEEDVSVLSKTQNSAERQTNINRIMKQWIETQKSSQVSQPDDWGDRDCLQNSALGWELAEVESSDRGQKSASIEIKQESDWNYLKLPLAHCDRQRSEPELYYLILATPTAQISRSPIDSSASTTKESTAEVLGAVSHELKSPLTGIVGLSSLLKKQKLGTLNQRQLRYVELIHRSGKKMMGVVDDLLQLNALIAEQPLDTESIDLEFICRQLYQQIRTTECGQPQAQGFAQNVASEGTTGTHSVRPFQGEEWLTKVEPVVPARNSLADPTLPKINIDFGSEIAIANKSLLSSVLSHLIIETINSSQNFEQLEIQISSRLGMTAITIIGRGIASVTNKGFNLTIAEYLATRLGAKVVDRRTVDRCHLTLLLPKNKIQASHPAPIEPNTSSRSATTSSNLTILCLYPELEVIDPSIDPDRQLNLNLQSCSDNYGLSAYGRHRVIEADSIEQAHNLARIWRLDAIILNGYQIARPSLYLRSLQQYEHLASLPLITLDTRTTEAANQIQGLNVFPCLIPSQCRSIEDLIQAIQIAIES